MVGRENTHIRWETESWIRIQHRRTNERSNDRIRNRSGITLAHRGSNEGFRVFVCSGDRDAIQMINDDVTLLYPNARGVSELKRYDRDTVFNPLPVVK